jgi:hypothetical protein
MNLWPSYCVKFEQISNISQGLDSDSSASSYMDENSDDCYEMVINVPYNGCYYVDAKFHCLYVSCLTVKLSKLHIWS